MEPKKSYIPPFTISAGAISQIADIAALVEHFIVRMSQPDALLLRRANKIKSIRSSLAIEGNTLSEEQVSDILNGKTVVAPPRQIQEVKNAIATYDLYPKLDHFSSDALLLAHQTMMLALIDDAGMFRRGNVGVMDGKTVLHMAPPAGRVPYLIEDLFSWLKNAPDHLLIKSCVFHYEFEFIHPFADGNGRMGRLWQSLILGQWNPIFQFLPVENMVHDNQQNYYEAINASTAAGNSTPFIDFMLGEIKRTLKRKVAEGKGINKGINEGLNETCYQILQVIVKIPNATAAEIGELIGKSQKTIEANLKKLRELNRIKRTGARKNGSWQILPNQQNTEK